MYERKLLRKNNLEARLHRDLERRLELAGVTTVPFVQVVRLEQHDHQGCNWEAQFQGSDEADEHAHLAINHLKARFNVG